LLEAGTELKGETNWSRGLGHPEGRLEARRIKKTRTRKRQFKG